MANVWEHPSMIAQEALGHLEDALIIAPLCTKDVTAEYNVRPNGWSVGDTVSFRTHGEYKVTSFTTEIETQPISSSTRSMRIEEHFDISVEVTSREAAMDLDSFSAQVIQPAMYSLAEKADQYIGSKILQAQGLYVSDDLLASAADAAKARKAATLQQLSTKGRYCLVDLDLEAKLIGATWFNQASTRGRDGERTLRNGEMGMFMGMDWAASLSFPTNASVQDCGTMICVTNNGTDGTQYNNIGDTSLIVDTQTASKALAIGDRIAIAGVRRPLVVKTAIADTTAATEVVLAHPITEIIPDNAAVTVIGSGLDLTFQGAIFDDRTIGIASPMLDLPGDKEVAAVASNNGISVRIVKGYNMKDKKTTLSMDFLLGAIMLDTRRATLLANY